jgi:hypothetical protein
LNKIKEEMGSGTGAQERVIITITTAAALLSAF